MDSSGDDTYQPEKTAKNSINNINFEKKAFTFELAKELVSEFILKEKMIPTTSENFIIRKVYDRVQKGSKQIEGKIKNWPHLISLCIQDIEDKSLKRELTNQYQEKLYYNRKREWRAYGLKFNSKNQLKSRRSDLIKQLHPTLNYGKLPHKMHYESDTQLWWTCDIKHKYRMSLSKRTIQNKDCPICDYENPKATSEAKPKYFWQTLDPGYNYALQVLIDFFIDHQRVPAASENKNIYRIYKALRNPKVKKVWGIDSWSELLRMTIGNLGYEMGELRDNLITSYNEIVKSQKHLEWVKIIV